MNKFIFVLIMFLSVRALAFEDMPIHQHYIKLMGVLPKPYVDFVLEIELDKKTDDARRVKIFVGGKKVHFPKVELEKLKDINLGDISLQHGMHRSPENPTKPLSDYMQDYVLIRMTTGEKKRTEIDVNGKQEYEWGYDPVIIMVIPGKPARVGSTIFDVSDI